MKDYIAFLRGINLGPHNRVKMVDLAKAFEDMGFIGVRTFIQSGNVLFSSGEAEGALAERIEAGIEEAVGIRTPVIIRADEELKQIISNCPFSENEAAEAEKELGAEVLYVCLFAGPLAPEIPAAFDKYISGDEKLHISGRDVYLFLRKGIRASKLAGKAEKLGSCTTRNFKMLNRLYAFSQGLEK